jgi:hypothetical protein
MPNSITPPPHLLKKFSAEARDESNKRNGAGYLKTFAKLCIEWANSKSTSNDRQIRSSEITPPPELVNLWMSEDAPWDSDSFGVLTARPSQLRHIAAKAAQWGADQELEACCEWFSADVVSEVIDVVSELRAARRPQPPSLKAQALGALGRFHTNTHTRADEMTQDFDLIRTALEALDD